MTDVISAVVLDIEGTISPTESVHALFDYTYERLPQWLYDNQNGDAAEVIAAVRKITCRPRAKTAQMADVLRQWLRDDVKAKPLKLAQGLICHEGFANGELKSVFYEDVLPALIMWHAAGYTVAVYSSGSVQNQKDWFGKSAGLIDEWFDLTAGSKKDRASYDAIADELNLLPWQILYLSDHPEEIAAASEAGWNVLGVARQGEPHEPYWRKPVPAHHWIASFDEMERR